MSEITRLKREARKYYKRYCASKSGSNNTERKIMKKITIMIAILVMVGMVSQGCQSRAISRLTGISLKLELPSDFFSPISFAAGRAGEKDLFYWTKSGDMKVKTYSDWGILEAEIIFK